MGIAGITGAVRGRHRTKTTTRQEKAARHPDLVERGGDVPTETDQLWVADFSYVQTLAGFVYVAFVVDVFSRRILGWRVAGEARHSGELLVSRAVQQPPSPATSSGYRAAYVIAYVPPVECPTSMNGPRSPALASSAWSSSADLFPSRGLEASSLYPCPARS